MDNLEASTTMETVAGATATAGSIPTSSPSLLNTTNEVEVEVRSPDLELSIEGSSDVDMLKQRLETVSKKRKELQQMEIELRAQIIARTQMTRNDFDSHNKEPDNIFDMQTRESDSTVNTCGLQTREPDNAVSEVEQSTPQSTVEQSTPHSTPLPQVVTPVVMTPFTTDTIFKDRETLISWCRDVGRNNGVAIIIKKSDSVESGRTPRISFACDKSGKLKTRKTVVMPTEKEIGSKLTRKTGSKKCGCPFLLKGVKINESDQWKLVVVCGTHNHPLNKDVGHSYARKLTPDEKKLLRDLTITGVKPRAMLTILKEQFPNNESTIENIYNYRAAVRISELEGRSRMQEIKEITDPKSTFFQEASKKVNPRGRPRKKRAISQVEGNTERDLSGFDYSETDVEQQPGSANVLLQDQGECNTESGPLGFDYSETAVEQQLESTTNALLQDHGECNTVGDPSSFDYSETVVKQQPGSPANMSLQDQDTQEILVSDS